jgi:hypothetical protein
MADGNFQFGAEINCQQLTSPDSMNDSFGCDEESGQCAVLSTMILPLHYLDLLTFYGKFIHVRSGFSRLWSIKCSRKGLVG